ncbi:MAG TPA: hypothetical protein VJ694_01370 [Patescibacteria group bacterium]|nr:hypothetical protein [Patescibacteria group bacterium]
MDDREFSRLYFEYARTKLETRYGVLIKLFTKAWCKETASPSCQDGWSPSNPAFGQCAVTALAIQTMCGGTLARTEVPGYGSHYFNRLVNGEGYSVYDLTKQQFPYAIRIPMPGEERDRAYVLHSPRAVEARTLERYELLKERLVAAMREG